MKFNRPSFLQVDSIEHMQHNASFIISNHESLDFTKHLMLQIKSKAQCFRKRISQSLGKTLKETSTDLGRIGKDILDLQAPKSSSYLPQMSRHSLTLLPQDRDRSCPQNIVF
jgi:hypothetical protein